MDLARREFGKMQNNRMAFSLILVFKIFVDTMLCQERKSSIILYFFGFFSARSCKMISPFCPVLRVNSLKKKPCIQTMRLRSTGRGRKAHFGEGCPRRGSLSCQQLKKSRRLTKKRGSRYTLLARSIKMKMSSSKKLIFIESGRKIWQS